MPHVPYTSPRGHEDNDFPKFSLLLYSERFDSCSRVRVSVFRIHEKIPGLGCRLKLMLTSGTLRKPNHQPKSHPHHPTAPPAYAIAHALAPNWQCKDKANKDVAHRRYHYYSLAALDERHGV